MLCVTLSEFSADEGLTVPWLIPMYNSLHEYYYYLLELKVVPLTFNLTVRPSDLVRVSPMHTK